MTTAIEMIDRLDVEPKNCGSLLTQSAEERALTRSVHRQAAFCRRVQTEPGLAAHMLWGCSARPTPADLDRLETHGYRVRRAA